MLFYRLHLVLLIAQEASANTTEVMFFLGNDLIAIC